MSLYKRGGVWWAYLYRDGIRHQYSTGTASRKKAENIETKLKEEINDQRFQLVQADPHMKFGELAARFMSSGSVRPHHLYHLKFLLPFFSETPALRITKSLADEFRRQRMAGKRIKDATVNRDLSALRHILYWAVDEQLMVANPLARMKMARERRSIRATKQRDRADAEAAVAQAVNDFLQNDLLAQASAATQSGPSAKPDPHLEVRTALDRAAVRIAGKFDRQPEVEASIRDTIGQTYRDLGLYPPATSTGEPPAGKRELISIQTEMRFFHRRVA